MLRYTEEHEWLRLDGEEVTVGITEYAAQQLGDLGRPVCGHGVDARREPHSPPVGPPIGVYAL